MEAIHLDEDNIYNLYLSPSLKIWLILMLVIFVGVSIFFLIFPFTFKDQTGPPWFIGIFWIIIVAWNLFWVLRIPHKIIFYKNGSLEFRSVLRNMKMLATEIKSIRPEGPTYGFLVVTAKKKIRILSQFDNFHELVSKLKTLNPSVELRGC
jgi:hypothetical protein